MREMTPLISRHDRLPRVPQHGVARLEGGRGGGEAVPLVSVITATLNAASGLPYTLGSMALQSGADFEWIVIDGGSRDGTIDLLRNSEHLIARWCSEPDAGIYDAWNKACAIARGEWILFQGAGDEFVSPDSLASVSSRLRGAYPLHDLVYCKMRYISPGERHDLEEVGVAWSEVVGKWEIGRPALPPHATIFHHRSLFADGRQFDSSFRIAGDSHFLLRYGMRKQPLYVPEVLMRTPVHGMSLDLRRAAAIAREIRRMNRELGLVPPLGHRVVELLLLGAKVAAGYLPSPIGHRVADLYRRLRGWPARWSVR